MLYVFCFFLLCWFRFISFIAFLCARPVGRAPVSFVWVMFVVIVLFLYCAMLCVVLCEGLVGLCLLFGYCFWVFCVSERVRWVCWWLV